MGCRMSSLEGAILSDYLLLECISQGSVADVYRARQNDTDQYEVAVKIFRPAYAERETFRAYFLQQADKIGQFDHPHILPFIEYGEGEGLLYSVTPFVKSGTLSDLLKRVGGKFSAMQVLPIVQQLCDAVQYAHERECVHGNIKPRNVFIASDGRMLLADFGIARGYADGQQMLAKMEWGSTQYAAPEQSLGLLRRGSDIYALGAVFFCLLTGTPVFSGQTPVEVLLKHVRQAPPSARSLVPNIAEAVDAVLQRALSKRSDDRYPTAAELSRAFAAAVTIAPTAQPGARAVNLTTRTLTPDPQMSMSDYDYAESIAMQPTVPIMVPAAFQTLQISSPVLVQPSTPQPSVLPEQHGLTSLAYGEAAPASRPFPGQSPTYWSQEPVEWSPLAHTQTQTAAGGIPIHAAEYLRRQSSLERLPETSGPPELAQKKGLFLPLLVLLLLLLGLLGAMLSSFLLPAPATHGASLRAVPAIVLDQTDAHRALMGG